MVQLTKTLNEQFMPVNLKLGVVNGVKTLANLTSLELKETETLLTSLPVDERYSFLNKLVLSTIPAGQPVAAPKWLTNGTTYEHNVWDCHFGKSSGASYRKTINFDIKLDDGLPLTHLKHNSLLNTFKYWICTQTHPRFSGGIELKPISAYHRVLKVTHLIDAILLNSARFQLSQHGLGLLTKDEISNILIDVSSTDLEESIYQYTERVEEWLTSKISGVTVADILWAEQNYSVMSSQEKKHGRTLRLNGEELYRAKVYLLKAGAYRLFGRNILHVHKGFFSPLFYTDTLHGLSIKPSILSDLSIGETLPDTEFACVAIRAADVEGIDPKLLALYVNVMKRLSLATNQPTFSALDKSLLPDLNSNLLLADLKRKKEGRFLTLPADLAFKVLRQGLEFSIENADAILDGVFNVLSSRQNEKVQTGGKTVILNRLTTSLLSEKLRKLGVRKWCIGGIRTDVALPHEYFDQLRKNVGLYELYSVLIGAIQAVVGTVMARRQGELVDLHTEGCLVPMHDPDLIDHKKTNFYLVFDNRKSGSGHERERLERPILRIGAKLIHKLQKFNRRCIEARLMERDAPLFQYLNKLTGEFSPPNSVLYNKNLDLFCDYIETATFLDTGGNLRRYYIRQHQLRRFFAMTFFWGSGFDGLDALRYFLGHTDTEHLYHYITESVSGRVLRGVKANKIADSIRSGGGDISGLQELRTLLEKRFGSKQIHIKTFHEIHDDIGFLVEDNSVQTLPPFEEFMASQNNLEDEIFGLLEEEVIDLEPDFFRVKNNQGEIIQDYKLVLKVKGTDYVD